MADTLTASPEQATIAQPISETGKSILSSIFDGPIKPSEVKPGTDLKELKKELGDRLQDSDTPDEPPKKTPEEEEAEFTKQFQKKDDDTEVIEPEKKKEEPKKEEKKEEKKPESKTETEEDDEAKGKIKNIQDARKLYKEHKKLQKESAEAKATNEKELKEAREELAKLKDAPKPDAAAIAEQEKELAGLRAEKEFIKQKEAELEQRAAAYSVQETEPYKRLVIAPLERMGADLEDLASAVSDDKDDQIAFMQAVGSALQIEDPKMRRKAMEEVGAPLTTAQQVELIQLSRDHAKVMGDKNKILGDSQNALKIIREKQDMDRKEWSAKNAHEFKSGALEARAELKKMYKFFERTDLPEDVKAKITELETAIDQIDPAKLPAREVGKITEAYYRGKILNDAASKHIAHMEKAEAKFRADLEAAQKEIADLKAKLDGKTETENAVDGTRPNLDSGNTNTTDPGKIDTIEGMVSNIFRV